MLYPIRIVDEYEDYIEISIYHIYQNKWYKIGVERLNKI